MDDQKIIQNHIDKHFRETMGLKAEHEVRLEQNIWEKVHTLRELDDEITEEEMREAIKEQAQEKMPRPDGFSLFFYNIFWEVIREDMMKLITKLNQGKERMDRLNYVNIVLIPKKNIAEYITDYRLILLLNNTVKIITKILANRLAPKLLELVGEYQTRFIKGRNILDRI